MYLGVFRLGVVVFPVLQTNRPYIMRGSFSSDGEFYFTDRSSLVTKHSFVINSENFKGLVTTERERRSMLGTPYTTTETRYTRAVRLSHPSVDKEFGRPKFRQPPDIPSQFLQKISSQSPLKGDLDLDGDVDLQDFIAFSQVFGQQINQLDPPLAPQVDQALERAYKFLGFWTFHIKKSDSEQYGRVRSYMFGHIDRSRNPDGEYDILGVVKHASKWRAKDLVLARFCPYSNTYEIFDLLGTAYRINVWWGNPR